MMRHSVSANVNLTEANTAAAISHRGTLTISDVDSPAVFVVQTGVGTSSYGHSLTSAPRRMDLHGQQCVRHA